MKFKKYFSAGAALLSFLLSCPGIHAGNFFFEAAEQFSPSSQKQEFPEAINASRNGGTSYILWQESDGDKVSLCASSSKDGINWSTPRHFSGAIPFSGSGTKIYSSAQSGNNIAVAAASQSGKILVFSTSDGFSSVRESCPESGNGDLTAPRIFKNSTGGFTLFACCQKDDGFSIVMSKSLDSITWQPFTEFKPAAQLSSAFNPVVPLLVVSGTSETVIFQSQYTEENILSVQLFFSHSKDGGKSWTKPELLLSGKNFDTDEIFRTFSNQGAQVSQTESGKTFIAWEHSPFNSSNADIFAAELDTSTGRIKGLAERISSGGFCTQPRFFTAGSSTGLTWFLTTEKNSDIFISQKDGMWWTEPETLPATGSFAVPVRVAKDEIALFWQKEGKLGILKPDHFTAPPVLSAKSFSEGKKTNSTKVTFTVSGTKDSSGVKGFSWEVTKKENGTSPEKIMEIYGTHTIEAEIAKDGMWFIKARQSDFAGNWSEAATLSVNVDTKAPEKISFTEPEKNSTGFLPSNSFALDWQTSDEDTEGYSVLLELLSTVPYAITENRWHRNTRSEEETKKILSEVFDEVNSKETSPLMPSQIITKETSRKFSNLKNGIWRLSVAAIDDAGNIGEPESIQFALNRFVPFTSITSAKSFTGEDGITSVSVVGEGFTYGGNINAVYIDRDGAEPYDKTLLLSADQFKIHSDRRITADGIEFDESGEYRIGLHHPARGICFSGKPLISVPETGTVKQRNKFSFKNQWKLAPDIFKRKILITHILFALLAILATAGVIASTKILFASAREVTQVNAEIKALMKGDIMPQEKKIKAKIYRKKGVSLKTKLVIYSSVLIASMDILVFLFFGFYMIRTQQRTLSESLMSRVSVMMNSVANGTSIYLPQSSSTDNLSLTDILGQVTALDECTGAMITGFPEDRKSSMMNYVWASDGKGFAHDGKDRLSYIPGTTQTVDRDVLEAISRCMELNAVAGERVEKISSDISQLTAEGIKLASETDEKSLERRGEIQTVRSQLVSKLDSILNEISHGAEGSIPEFNGKSIDPENTDYIFYKPVLYRQGASSEFLHGTVLLKVSTLSLLEEIETQRNIIAGNCALIFLVSIILAFGSTYILASVIVRPIERLADHVAMIRDTDDKETLSGKTISIRSHDEIGVLGDTVNEMTHGLVEAAIQGKNLTIGKDVQTKFLPLDTKDGITLTTGRLAAQGASFFSYYNGADELSGDYFDYKQLDENHYAIIKCDVSGHGVPAALIMIEVATLFLSYFNNWDMKNPAQGTNIAPVVGQINDLLESRSFRGRFAAFTLCIMNTKTGECWFCNAGDNMVHVYDGTTRQNKTITLQETPAAGMFSTDLVNMKGGYKVSKVVLKKDDILILVTDGIEEAKRTFRNAQAECIEEKDEESGELSATEEMGSKRVSDIVECVCNRKKYTLHKKAECGTDKDYVFDFSTAQGTEDECIMALVAVEKIFRMYRSESPVQNDRVKVDRNIDDFLRKYFTGYSELCSDKADIEGEPSHIWYCGIREDPQYDDLTLVAVRKQ